MEYIKPYYLIGKRGSPPKRIEKMLRMYLHQCWFNLSDEGVEDAIYDSYAMEIGKCMHFVRGRAFRSKPLLISRVQHSQASTDTRTNRLCSSGPRCKKCMTCPFDTAKEFC